MANEISWSNLETDAGLAHYLSGEVHTKLYDPTDLRRIMVRRGFMPNQGSETVKTTQVTRGQVFAAASTELSGGASYSSIGSGNFQRVHARRTMKWQVSDLWRMVAINGSINLDLLASIINEAAGLTCTDLLCTAFTSLSGSVGSTTTQMSVSDAYDAQAALNNNRAPGPFFLVLAPHPMNKFIESVRGEGGAVQWIAATPELIAAKGPGFKGTWNGWEVWDSDSVPLDGGSTYRTNAMIAAGAFEYGEAPVASVADALPSNVVKIMDGTVRIVHAYDADNALTTVHGDYYPAVVEAEDARATRILSLAA